MAGPGQGPSGFSPIVRSAPLGGQGPSGPGRPGYAARLRRLGFSIFGAT